MNRMKERKKTITKTLMKEKENRNNKYNSDMKQKFGRNRKKC